jgi:hypothetical protein
MTIKNPVITTARDQIVASREVLNSFISVRQGTNELPDLELLDDASGHLAEALVALDRVIGEPR